MYTRVQYVAVALWHCISSFNCVEERQILNGAKAMMFGDLVGWCVVQRLGGGGVASLLTTPHHGCDDVVEEHLSRVFVAHGVATLTIPEQTKDTILQKHIDTRVDKLQRVDKLKCVERFIGVSGRRK